MIGKLLRTRYEATQALGEGPVFSSFVAHDRVQSREVCLRTFKQPFAAERPFVAAVGKAVAKFSEVRHPSLERIYELDEDDDVPFLVGELSPGMPLPERIRKLAPFSVPVAVATAVSVGEGLSALHMAGLVHGDVGAHNIVTMPEGDARLQVAGVWEAYSASETAGIVMLPALAPYLAPEISRGEMPSAASDVYALGIVLFQMLTGRFPFVAEQPVAMALKHATDAVPTVRLWNASVPSALEQLLLRALAKQPAERYKDAVEIVADLRTIQDALRFGKSLHWPLRGAPKLEPVQVAPVSADTKSDPQAQQKRKKRAEAADGDVPSWLRMALVFFVSLVVFMLGAWILFNLNRPRTVALPDLRRLTLAEAESRLRSLRLRLKVARREANERQQADTVLDTDPSPGSQVVEGQSVGVVLSLGSKFVEVPDVLGVTVDKAKEMLDSLGLKVDDRVTEVRDRSAEPGTVVGQVPERGNRVERGTSVRLQIATRNAPGREDPQDRVKYLYTVRIVLSDIDESVTLRVDMTDSRGTKTVHEEEHFPNDEVEITAEGYGREAQFRIFYDGELVKQVVKRGDEDGSRL